jgi:hypothetical protein
MNGGSVRQAVTVITPTASNCTGVTVAAQVRMQATQGVAVNPQDIFGQILIS